MIAAGQLNSRIEIQVRERTQDAYGQLKNNWMVFCSVWANIRYLSGLETIKQNVEFAESKVSIRIRYRQGLNAGMRVLYNDSIYDIESVLPDVRRVYIDLACRVINNDS